MTWRIKGALAQSLGGLRLAPGQHVSVTIEVATDEGTRYVSSLWRVDGLHPARTVRGDEMTVVLTEAPESFPMLSEGQS